MDDEQLQEEQQEETVVVEAPESVEETIQKSIEELQGTTESTEETEVEEAETEDSEEESIPVPGDWTAEAKEAFKSYPKEVQKELSRISRDYEAYRKREINNFTTQRKAWEQEKALYEPLKTTVARYLPLWGRQGLTPEAAFNEICAFYTDFMSDPEYAMQQLAQKAGVKVQIEGGSKKNQVDPHVYTLTQEVNALKNYIESSQAQAVNGYQQSLAQNIDSTFGALQNEEVMPGRFKYPDLHNPQFVKEHIEPLVIGLAKANPHQSDWSDLIKKAYVASGGRVIPNTTPATTKLNGGNRHAARRAATSVSGVGSGESAFGDIPFIPNESVEDTIRRTMAAARSR